MKKIAAINLFFAFLIASLPTIAASSAVNECIELQSDNWSEQERWVWQQICMKEEADFNLRLGFDRQMKPWEANSWTQEQILSSAFVYDILLREPFVSAIANLPVRIFGAWFPESINLDGATLGNSISIAGARFDEPFSMVASNSKFRLSFPNSWFGSDLNFATSDLTDLLLIISKIDGDIGLVGTTAKSIIHLGQSEISGYVNLNNASSESLGLELQGLPVVWKGSAQLSLRSTKIEGLVDLESSWTGLKGKLDLQGFTYEGFSNSASTDAAGSAESAAERPVESLLNWIEMQKSRDEVYISQPYEQLATVLRKLGQNSKADSILYAKNEYRRTHVTTPLIEKVWLGIKKGVIGYGYQIWLTVFWYFVLIGIGGTILRYSKQGRGLGVTQSVLYAIDQAIPLINLQPSHEKIAGNHSLLLKSYFMGHQILSLILLSFLGAGLAGAIG